MVSLSFNRKLVPGAEIEQAVPKADLAKVNTEKPIPLRYTWALWEQLQQSQATASTAEPAAPVTSTNNATYGDLTAKVASIGDVQSFWNYFVHLPQPSQILGESKKIVRQESEDGPAHTLAALMFFKGEIRPEWEDEANRRGGHFQFTLQLERSRSAKDVTAKESGPNAWLAQTDEYWNNIVLGLIGGTLDPEDFVTGVRLVDKVKPPPRQGARPVGHIRVEIWFRDAHDAAKINALKESLESHMRCRIDGTLSSEIFPGYRLDMRSHEETTHDDKFKGPRTRTQNNKKFPRKGSAEEPLTATAE